MKKLFFPLLTMSILLMGCPYESKNPLSEPNVKVPSAIFGTFEKKNAESDGTTKVKVEKITDYHFLMTEVTAYPVTAESNELLDTTFYIGYLTKIDNDYFVNNLGYSTSNINDMYKKIAEIKNTYNSSASTKPLNSASSKNVKTEAAKFQPPVIVPDNEVAVSDAELDLSKGNDIYYIYKIEGNFTENKFKLLGLTKNLSNELFKSSNDFYSYVAKNKNLGILYDANEIFTYFRLTSVQ